MTINVVLTGPESTGKTFLTNSLSKTFNIPIVSEIARDYLSGIKRQYLPSDLLTIAERQHQEELLIKISKGFVADTDQQVLSIWWQEKYGPLPDRLVNLYEAQCERFYLLCYPDVPWEQDPLRENEHDRQRIFNLYKLDLEKRDLPHKVIKGSGKERTELAIQAICSYKDAKIF